MASGNKMCFVLGCGVHVPKRVFMVKLPDVLIQLSSALLLHLRPDTYIHIYIRGFYN